MSSALANSLADQRIQIGKQLLAGLGAGAKPELGKAAIEEDKRELDACLENVEMVFLTCGLGGGTGTGAIPIIVGMCRERNILTVAVVTTPFFMEGFIRNSNSKQGLENLKSCVDTLLVIPNDRLLEDAYCDYSFEECLKLADDVLVNSVSAICNIIFQDGMINIDFGDVRTIMENTGLAYIGFGRAHSSSGLMDALEEAIHSPLLETDIRGAKKLIINCSGKVSMSDMQKALTHIHSCTNPEANIILGTVTTPNAEEEICVTIIATELEQREKDTDTRNSQNTKVQVMGTAKPLKVENTYAEPMPYQYRNQSVTKRKEENKVGVYRYGNRQEELKIPSFIKQYAEKRG